MNARSIRIGTHMLDTHLCGLGCVCLGREHESFFQRSIHSILVCVYECMCMCVFMFYTIDIGIQKARVISQPSPLQSMSAVWLS
jgi:hypothetical protein